MYRGKQSIILLGITASLTHAGSEKENKLPEKRNSCSDTNGVMLF